MGNSLLIKIITRSYYSKDSVAGSYAFLAFDVIMKNRRRSIVYLQYCCNNVHNRLERSCAAYIVQTGSNFRNLGTLQVFNTNRGRSIIRGGGHIHILMFTERKTIDFKRN